MSYKAFVLPTVCFQDVLALMKKVFGDAEMRQADAESLASLPKPVRRPRAAPAVGPAEGKANGSNYASAESGDDSSDDDDCQQSGAAVKKAPAVDRKRAAGVKREVKC